MSFLFEYWTCTNSLRVDLERQILGLTERLVFGEQIGQKSLGLGVKFKAKAVVEVTEEEPQDLHDGVLRDLHFDTVEGDFQVFKGTWRMHQVSPSLAFLL